MLLFTRYSCSLILLLAYCAAGGSPPPLSPNHTKSIGSGSTETLLQQSPRAFFPLLFLLMIVMSFSVIATLVANPKRKLFMKMNSGLCVQ